MKKYPSRDEQVRPDRWLPKGEAVVLRREKPLVVWSGIPGEMARVKVVHRGQNQDFGFFDETDTPDPHRVAPPCDRYTLCGGCPIMHLDAPGQEKAHRDLVRAALDEAGLQDVAIGAYHAADSLAEFRHVIKLGFGFSDQGHPRVGAWGRRDAAIVPIPRCEVAVPVLRSVMVALAHHSLDLGIRPFDDRGRGVLRAAVIRVSRTTGEVLLTLVAGKRIRELQDLAEAVAGQVSAIVGVWVHLNAEPGNAIFVRDDFGSVPVLPLVGKETIEERLGDVVYSVGPGDFFQTQPAMAERLYARAIERIDEPLEVPLVDLYSGVGGIALQAAAKGRWALGVEEVEGAVFRARDSARRQSLQAEFQCSPVGAVLPDLARRLGARRPIVVVDPARRGLEDGVVDGIVAMTPRKVVYVSCNPAALARDLVRFRQAGLSIGEIELFDMFPNTPHVECLVTLSAETAADAPEPGGRGPRRKVVR